MRLACHRPDLLVTVGVTVVAAALAWWGLTYWPTVRNDYLSVAEAGRCLVSDSSLCHLATSLCGTRHAALAAVYSPIALWIGAAVACAGLWPASPPKPPGEETA